MIKNFTTWIKVFINKRYARNVNALPCIPVTSGIKLLLITPLLPLLIFSSTCFAQQKPANSKPLVQLTGVVKDESGLAVPGVTVRVRNTSIAVATDGKGQFKVAVPGLPTTLLFSAISYKYQEKTVSSTAQVDIVLESVQSNLNEVVVIGYGSAKKSDVTGSVGSVNMKNVDEAAYDNFQQALAGKVAGVVVSQTSGSPGAGLNVEIRGVNSLSYGTNPLYVVDGVPLENPNVGALVSTAYTLGASGNSPLAAINPNDIASIEFLKDASATAIYGSRGANGVVLITTKKGKPGVSKINANISNGYSSLEKSLKVLSGPEYATYANEAATNRGTPLPYNTNEIASQPTYDHQQDITHTARTTDANVTLSGGDAKSNFYLSGQYYNQEGIILYTGLNRYNFKTNYQNQIFEKLKLTTSINYTKSAAHGNVLNSQAGGLLYSALVWAPNSPFINPDGSINVISDYHYGSSFYNDPTLGSIYYNPVFNTAQSIASYSTLTNNPLTYLNGVINVNTSSQLLANVQLDYKISKSLSINGLLGYTTYNSLLENYIPITAPVYYVTGLKGVASVGDLESTKLLYQASITYDKHFGKHALNAVLVATAEQYEEKLQTAATQSFTTDATGVYNIQGGSVLQTPTTNVLNNALVSTIFRTSYNYDTRYYVTVSGRYDGSSKFAEGNQFGFFPSLGLSWRMTNEKWFKKTGVINEIKLRGSVGVIGNQAVGPYSTLSTLSSANVAFGGVVNAGYAPSRLPNTSLKWEEARQADIGADMELLKNRIDLTIDAYNRTTPNLIYNITLPGTSGFATIPKNIGSIQNQGLEISLNTVNVKTKSLTWSTNFNIAFNQNKVLQLTGSPGEFVGVNALIGSSYLTRIQPGEPIGQYYGFINLPVWNDQTILTKPAAFQATAKAGDVRYADINGDGVLNDADRVYLGTALPKFAGGFGTSVSYKQFDLQALFTYQYGNKVFNQLRWSLGSLTGSTNILKNTFDDRYITINASTDPSQIDAITAHNAVTTTPRAGVTYDVREVSSSYLEDASFIRCRDIVLNYNFKPAVLRKLKVSNLGLFFNLQNGFIFTHYSGYNPEVNTGTGLSRGLDNGANPLSRTYRLGIKVGI